MLIINKFTSPSKYDYHKFGTIWQNQIDDKEVILYIQTSIDEANPNWMRLSEYLESIIRNYYGKSLNKNEAISLFSDLLR